MEEDPIRQPMHDESRKLFVRSTLILIMLSIATAGIFFWSYVHYRKITSEDPVVYMETQPTNELQDIIEPRNHDLLLQKIEKHMTLPVTGTPEISTVNDEEVLIASQSFFKNVKNNDTLIIYDDFAVIYRESEDIIINSGVVNNDDSEKNNEDSEKVVVTDAPGADTTVEVRNGTAINGYAGRVKDELVILAYTIDGIGNAFKKTYNKTIIVKKSFISRVAIKALEIKFDTIAIIELPEGEDESSSDIVIILGGSE